MKKIPVRARARGFTLIELLAVLLVLSVTAAVGAPALHQTLIENRLQSQAQRLMGSLALARMAAIGSGETVSLCPSSMARDGEAACSGSYADGWIVFANRAGDRVVQPSADRVLRVYDGLPTGYRVTNRRSTRLVNTLINYRPDGSSRQNLTLQICPPDNSSGLSRSIVLNIVGRARIDRDWGSCEWLA